MDLQAEPTSYTTWKCDAKSTTSMPATESKTPSTRRLPFFGRTGQPALCSFAKKSARRTENDETCTKCGKEKQPPEFPANHRLRDRLDSWCRECHREANRRWRAEHREEINLCRQVVSAFVYDPELRTYVPNPSPRPKSKVR
jgi:hypothetical protein